jgi:hypothetical protein
MSRAIETYQRFHLKRADKIIQLHVSIPRFVYPIAKCTQLSYRSDKWNDDNEFENYIHEWDHETLVCVPKKLALDLNGRLPNQRHDLGQGTRNEVVYLGYAIDFDTDDGYYYKFQPKKGNYVVCSPNERIVYVIVDNTDEVYAFINPHIRIKPEGITG